jgi:glutamate racemase
VLAAPAAYHGAVASRTADPRARPIAVFDSGVGGLTVLHELLVQLPHEDFLYLADAARLPYGTRTQAELERFALQCAEELLARGAKLLVVACNSATAAALPALRERMAQTTLGIDVLGVVQPGAVQAVAATTNGRVGLMATPATVASGAYASAIAQADPFVELTAVACPDLTAIIEGGFPFDERVVDTVRGYVAPLRAAGVDTVILGCTHYPLIAPMLQRMLGRGVRIVTSGTPVAHQVEHVLGARGLANPRGADEGDYRFLTTGDVEAFRALGSVFLQLPLGDVERVALRADLERPEADRHLQTAGLDAPRR